MPESQIQVLVVGAGPTGLALAANLCRLGIRVLLIDKNAARSDKSKALGVQAGTLEHLQREFGDELPQALIAAGLKAQAALFHLDGNAPVKVDLSHIPSAYNFVLLIEQSETERVLEEELVKYGGRVERNTTLIECDLGDSDVRATVRLASGEMRDIRADYIVGCDGAHSTVRHLAKIPFEGGAYSGSFALGDIEVEWPWEHGNIRTFLSAKGIVATFPIRGNRVRMILIRRGGLTPEDKTISEAEFTKLVDDLLPERVRLLKFHWLTRFTVNHRMVRGFRKGPLFLAGDAAHIHSPIGGQGMNLGIQDGLVLAQKIATGKLDEYERQRFPIAKRVVKGTDFVSKIALSRETFVTRVGRAWILPRILRSAFFQKFMARTISQTARVIFFLAAFAAASSSVARQQEGRLTFDNDYRAMNLWDTDENYTNGLRFSYLLARDNEPTLGWAVGQKIFTPKDISRSDIVANDRPYAGWLYAGLLWQERHRNFLHNLELNFGVVGPSSLAAQTQKTVHGMIGFIDPKGWGNQLHDEPGVILNYDIHYRFINLGWLDFTPHADVALGNVDTHVSTGGMVRLGYGLSDDFGPTVGALSYLPPTPNNRFRAYVFADGLWRAVGRDIFLDGNTFRDSHRVEKYVSVLEGTFGAAVEAYGVSLMWREIVHTPEFRTQPTNGHAFGSITLAVRYAF